jgi:hypothetical protein
LKHNTWQLCVENMNSVATSKELCSARQPCFCFIFGREWLRISGMNDYSYWNFLVLSLSLFTWQCLPSCIDLQWSCDIRNSMMRKAISTGYWLWIRWPKEWNIGVLVYF